MRLYDDQLIVITGGAGFIGSNVVRHLNDRGIDNIVIVDELGTDDKWKNLVGKRFYSILEKDDLFEWLKNRESEIEAFIHLGACSDTMEKDASYLLQNNYRFSVRLAEYALRYGHRFIYASSAATYGSGAAGFSDDHNKLDLLEPLNMYGYSKHLFDQWVKNQGALNKVVGLKYFNVFGPNEWHKGRMASAIFHTLPLARKEGVIKLFKSTDPTHFPDGEQQRDFIYSKDAARMTAAFLENDATGIFNIGRGEPVTWKQLAEATFKAINQPVNIEYVNMPEALVGNYQNYTCADMAKTRKALGKNAVCMGIEESVIDYVKNYLMPEKRL